MSSYPGKHSSFAGRHFELDTISNEREARVLRITVDIFDRRGRSSNAFTGRGL